MLVLTREVGQSFVIEDVMVTLVHLDSNYVEISLRKQTGGKPRIVTLTKDQWVEACYDTNIMLVKSNGSSARFAIEAPKGIEVHRLELI